MSGDDRPLDARALALFIHSLEVPAESRETWLMRECAGDESLITRVRRLIEADRASTGFLEARPGFEPLPDRTGERLGAFELLDEIATGGMSTVYRGCRADGAYEQDVAVKLFNAGHMDASVRRRFDAERRILAALEHPGIARIIDGGTAADGTPYLVMERVDGEPVTRYCRRHRLDLTGRLVLFGKICEALETAHRRGIIHRDIKAGNVLVTADGIPKLIDFGIARVVAGRGPEVDLPETRWETRLLTPEYASPEQLRGETVDVTSDIYSLGVLLYEMLTGRRPHPVADLTPAEAECVVCETVPADPSEAVRRHKSAPPEGLDERGWLRRRLRGDLDRIVMTALRHDPADRYVSAAALGEDIERHLSDLPVRARGASRWYRTGKFISRHRGVVATTTCAFMLLIGALVMVLLQAAESERQRARAVAARDFLTEMIMRADPFENTGSATLIGALKQSLPGIGDRFSGQPRLEADMRYAIGYALQNLGEIPSAREQLERALALREIHGSLIDQAEVHDGLAIVCWWESDFAGGERHFDHALRLLGNDDSDRAVRLWINVLSSRSAMQIDMGEYEHSRDYAERALAGAEAVGRISAETLATIWLNLATARDGLGENDEALEAFNRALELQRAATGEQHPSYAIILNNIGILYNKLERYREAEAVLSESVDIRRRTLGVDHPQTATALFNLARVQVSLGEYEAAEASAIEALEVASNGYPENHPRIGKAYEALAIVYMNSGDRVRAQANAERARAIYATASGVDPAWIEAVEELMGEL